MQGDDTAPVRRRRWAIAAVAAAIVVAAAVGLPRLLVEERPPPSSTTATGTACVADVDVSLASLDEEVASTAGWVRFCPLADEGRSQRVRHPQGVVTGDLAASVATTLWLTQVDRPVCTPDHGLTPGPTGLFRVEVGLADGRVAELAGDTGCSTRDATLFSQLETTLLMEAAGPAADGGPSTRPVTCPDRLTVTRTNREGASADQLVDAVENDWQSTVPLLPMPATTADVCAYTGRGAGRRLIDQWQVGSPASEQIRATATVEVLLGAITDCDIDPARTSYVVVLTDRTGTARTLAVDTTECGTVQAAVGAPPVDTYLGLASAALVRVVRGSRP